MTDFGIPPDHIRDAMPALEADDFPQVEHSARAFALSLIDTRWHVSPLTRRSAALHH